MVMVPQDKEAPIPAAFTQYFVCGTDVDYQGTHHDDESNSVRFYCATNESWQLTPESATRCNVEQALQILSAKQNVVGEARKENFFIVRADITLTRVKVDLVDYVKE